MFIKVTHDYDRKFGERHIINLEFQLLHFATVNLKLHHFSLEEHVLHSLAALYYKVCIYIYIYIYIYICRISFTCHLNSIQV